MRRRELALVFVAAFAGGAWVAVRLAPTVPAPAPVEIAAPCPAAQSVIDFPVYGGTFFRRSSVPCVWI